MKKTPLVLLTLTAACTLPLAQASETNQWQNHGGKASYLRMKGDYKESLNETKLALAALTPRDASRTYIPLDLQLGAVHTMMLAGMLDEAEDLLRKLEPLVLKDFKSTLLESRYWRRKGEVRHAQKQLAAAADAQEASCKIFLLTFGATSPTYAEELWLLIQARVASQQYELAIKDALKLRQIADQNLPGPERKRYMTWIGIFENQLTNGINQLLSPRLTAQKAQQATALLMQSFPLSLPDSDIWKLWRHCLIAGATANSAANRELANFAVNHINIQTAHSTDQLYLLGEAASSLLFHRIYNGKPEEKFDDTTENLTRLARQALEKIYTGKDLNKQSWYIQIASMHALTLAKRNKLVEAEKLMDSLIPHSGIVHSSNDLNGVFQARHVGLAEAFAKQGDERAVHRQYDKLRAILPLYSLNDSAVLIKGWIARENETIAAMRKSQTPSAGR